MLRNDTCTPVFIAVLFTIAKTWKQPKCPTEEWIKMWYIYTMDSAIIKNEIMSFAATWMDLECHTEWSKSDREGEIWHPLYVESKRKWYKWTYLQNRKRFTDLENKLMVAGEEGIVREFGTDMYTLLYFKWITSKTYCIAHGSLLNVMWQPRGE